MRDEKKKREKRIAIVGQNLKERTRGIPVSSWELQPILDSHSVFAEVAPTNRNGSPW